MGDAAPPRPDVELLPSAALEAADAQRAALLQTFEDKRAARQIAVPASEDGIRAALRRLGQPVCYYGEDLHDRRERLRAALAAEARGDDAGEEGTEEGAEGARDGARDGDGDEKMGEAEEVEEYYVEGSAELRELRFALARPTLERARRRLEEEKELRATDGGKDEAKAVFQEREAKAVECVRGSVLLASQVGDSRPLAAVAFGACPGRDRGRGAGWEERGNGAAEWVVATGSWSGVIKIWGGGADASLLQTIEKHTARVSSVVMPVEHPGVLLTAAADAEAHLFVARDADGDGGMFEHKTAFGGHSKRVSDCRMHPVRESLVVTCSFDGSFVLHDAGKALLTQATGHESVCGSSFHPDGGLLATCGTEGGVRLWDMRSGRAVMTMAKAHVGAATCLDFSGDGRVLASGGGDNTVKIWDLRGKRCEHTIPAHVGLVSGVRFAGGGGDVLVTSSFDKSVKVWTARRGWALLKAHVGHEDKVTGVDITPDARWIASATYDKTFKLWGVE